MRASLQRSVDTCIFCAIAHGNVEAAVLYEDEFILAFMDREPIRRGHVQIIPREHWETYDVLPPHLLEKIIAFAQLLAKRLKELNHVERVAFVFTGGDVAHAHAHVLPMVEMTDITSGQYILPPKPRLSSSHLRTSLEDLRASAAEIGDLKL